ncbi:hypothetical protein OUZ56_001112 [Daphnia magna]|uniref:Uncharacterized protein n=1 Tax=Daphnia magna TaxID=35525 RepID=A0ABR0A1P6_9CRUS|nr:hypothetical protein OUZ56_001112 [Daphnia magna]
MGTKEHHVNVSVAVFPPLSGFNHDPQKKTIEFGERNYSRSTSIPEFLKVNEEKNQEQYLCLTSTTRNIHGPVEIELTDRASSYKGVR